MWKKTMKNLLILPALLFFINVTAQDPVKWNFSAKKVADKTYEHHMTATVESPWSSYCCLTLMRYCLLTLFLAAGHFNNKPGDTNQHFYSWQSNYVPGVCVY